MEFKLLIVACLSVSEPPIDHPSNLHPAQLVGVTLEVKSQALTTFPIGRDNSYFVGFTVNQFMFFYTGGVLKCFIIEKKATIKTKK